MHLKNPYLRLMRLDKPVGIWLLFYPCAWSLALASGGFIDIWKLLLFAVGAVLMRSAGCIVNDIADREFDAQVERTKTRPLASGELSVKQAVFLLIILLAASLGVAISLGWQVIFWSALSLPLVAIYPLMKRFTWWPQLFLGLTFNWGALMGWAAVRGVVELPAILLYIGGICWTLGYDTIYAHQDKADDVKIGIKSSALQLGENTKAFVSIMYAVAIALFAIASCGILPFLPAAIHAIWQVYTLDINSPDSARRIFVSNTWFGLLVLLGILINTTKAADILL